MRDLYKVLGILIVCDINAKITSGRTLSNCQYIEVFYIWIDPNKINKETINLLELYGCFPDYNKKLFYYIIDDKPIEQKAWEAAARATE